MASGFETEGWTCAGKQFLLLVLRKVRYTRHKPLELLKLPDKGIHQPGLFSDLRGETTYES